MSIYGVDLVLYIAPADEKIGKGDSFCVERLKEADGSVYLVLNKIDLLSKDQLIEKLMNGKLFDFRNHSN